MFLRTKNRAESTLAAGIDDAVTSLSVAAAEGALFPTKNFHITIDDEILLCSSRSTDVLTVVRAQEGTAAAAHRAAATVELRITSEIIEQIQRGGGSINVEVLSAGKTLTPGVDEMYQYLDPGAANRIITLATVGAKVGDRFIVKNDAAYTVVYNLQIKSGVIIVDFAYSQMIKEFVFDGTNWISAKIGTGEDGSKKYNIGIGYSVKVYTRGTAVGYSSSANIEGVAVGYVANAYSYGVAVGRDADAYINGVAVGYYADGVSYGVALGYRADTNTKYYSVALGYYSKCERYSEIAHNIKGIDADQENNITIGGFERETANNTPVELWCGGFTNRRFTIRPSSVLVFKILITARDNVSGDCAAYKVEGAIKRDAAGNTVMLLAAVITVIHEDDAAWNVAVAADDTNEALVITVTGDDTNITQWAARLDGVETHF